ncbi:hypothetical protein EVAR_94051_1 [Eumeta japonica]|uniref:Uncharacterized protein n=1 Tax=Eumeta variegata TaxID=151549 RepID=A0A4C1V5E2_EUMVA|nr:hypothetical protein EVAR_94051_1 [Eumeta japonica]
MSSPISSEASDANEIATVASITRKVFSQVYGTHHGIVIQLEIFNSTLDIVCIIKGETKSIIRYFIKDIVLFYSTSTELKTMAKDLKEASFELGFRMNRLKTKLRLSYAPGIGFLMRDKKPQDCSATRHVDRISNELWTKLFVKLAMKRHFADRSPRRILKGVERG